MIVVVLRTYSVLCRRICKTPVMDLALFDAVNHRQMVVVRVILDCIVERDALSTYICMFFTILYLIFRGFTVDTPVACMKCLSLHGDGFMHGIGRATKHYLCIETTSCTVVYIVVKNLYNISRIVGLYFQVPYQSLMSVVFLKRLLIRGREPVCFDPLLPEPGVSQ